MVCETLFKNILHMCFVNCCRTERNQPTTFAQENMTVHYNCRPKTFSGLIGDEFITRMLYCTTTYY